MSNVFLFHPYNENVICGFQLHVNCFLLDSPQVCLTQDFTFCPLIPIESSKIVTIVSIELISANL